MLYNYENIVNFSTLTHRVLICASAEVQEIADYVGDSFYLAKIAKQTDADIIIFCGVQFMGESAKIFESG